MSSVVDDVYRYRALRGRCESGGELSMDDIHQLEAIEPRLHHTSIELPAIIRTRRFADPVRVVAIGPAGFVLAGCPWVDIDDVIELAVENADVCYQFKGKVTWTGDDAQGDLDVIATFVGVPLVLRRGPRSRNAPRSLAETIDQQIAA
jgi:hypothetical protein